MTMTFEEKRAAAKEYFERNTKPVQDLCPEIVQHWNSSNGTIHWSNKTGRRTHCASSEKDNFHLVAVQKEYYAYYIRYVEELDAVEISKIRLKGNRGVDGEPKDWEFIDSHYYYWSTYYNRNLIFHNDITVYFDDGTTNTETTKKYYNSVITNFLSNGTNIYDVKIIESEMKKFRHDFYIPFEQRYWGVYVLREWFKMCFMPRNNSKKSKEVLSYELDDIDISEYENNEYYRYGFFQVVDDEYAVIRVFRNANYNHGFDIQETSRIFIDTKGKTTIIEKTDASEAWRIKGRITRAWSRMLFINLDDIVQWKPLSYIAPCIDHKHEDIAQLIITMLRHPIIESLVKSGYVNIAKLLADDNQVNANMKKYFLIDKCGKGNLYKRLGVNKYLLQEFEKHLNGAMIERWGQAYDVSTAYMVAAIKNLYSGAKDITNLSKADVDMLSEIIGQAGAYCINDIFTDRGRWYCRYNSSNGVDHVCTEDERKTFMKLCRMSRDGINAVDLYKDVRKTYRQIDNKPGIDLSDFHNIDDLTRIHDALIEIQNREAMERRARYDETKRMELEAKMKKFEKLQDERVARFEYEDDEFCIRMPKHLNEITTEGSKLGHCVGGYVDSHATGQTNIIFLRRKAAENVPFYTIEVRGNNVIQIHGSHNRWLGNNPEAIPFVYEWIGKLGLKADRKMLLNKSFGYHPSSENLPDSYLYRNKAA